MNIVLNSRVLIGRDHIAADRYTRQWRPGLQKDIEWLQSPSELCVLSITRGTDEILPGEPAPALAKKRSAYPATLAMTNGLEDELRRHLGLKLPITSPH
ncbi:hypothetical protein [Haloferula sp. BvORR071]|uniref:hypothetical protein n=1 Tax=Haloferula sp. BvORR071 TaxID=1396141 RepID=UPI0005546F3D|nr:hypothetical protein [Haloferula sp. BvORR071]